MKFCSIYKKNEEIYFVSRAKHKDGMGRISEPIYVSSIPEKEKELTTKLVKCLDAYEIGKEIPDSNAAILKPLLKIAKCKSYKEFVKSTNLILVADLEHQIKLQPLISSRDFKGFESYKGLIIEFTKKELENNTVMERIFELFDEMEHSHLVD